jgi:hypothetical protein
MGWEEARSLHFLANKKTLEHKNLLMVDRKLLLTTKK